jgi:small GTP-binding protein
MNMLQKKILLVGDFGVGKSSLVERFVHSRFSEEYKSTIGVVISKKEVEVDQQPVKLLIWDVAGSREMTEVPASYYLGCSGLLYVFDLTRPETWQGMSARLNTVREMSKTDNILLIANKSDLCTREQIEQTLAEVNLPVDAVTSARKDDNVDQSFHELSRRILNGG